MRTTSIHARTGPVQGQATSAGEAAAMLPEWDGEVPVLLALDRDGPDRFRSRFAQPNYQTSIYGGQLMGQALVAAGATVAAGRAWSLHAYFINPGDRRCPIDFVVERLRDSRHSAARRVAAMQGELRLFEMLCHFREERPMFEHSAPAPDVPPPEALEDLAEIARAEPALLGAFGRFVLDGRSPVEIKPLSRADLMREPGARRRCTWLRVPSAAATDDPVTHRAMLAYLSDYWFSRVSLVPHRSPVPDHGIRFASIDHAMWFHRDARADAWLLYEAETPSAIGGTGLTRGQIFDRAGRLIASTTQDALQAPR